MPLPKALLCALGEYSPQAEEAALRQAGFATAVLHWKDLADRTNDWMQLAPILDDPAVQAWVLAGEAADFSEDLLCRVALLALALNRPAQPGTALVVQGGGPAPALPPLLDHVATYRPHDPFAARLMAARFKPGAALATPMHVRALPDPVLGLWLEVAPAAGMAQTDFSVGVLEAEITSFGVGPRGAIPARSQLDYPVLGVKGELGGRGFCACAARNELNEATACYCRVEGIPRGVFLGTYLDEVEQSGEAVALPLTAS